MSNDFKISTDKRLLDVDFVYEFTRNSYWGQGRFRQQTVMTIENSLCFGLYTQSSEQIGFGRIVTDYVFFGNIMDVFIAENHQGKGLGKLLMEYILEHEVVKSLNTVALKTKDAHSFYGKYGFKKIEDSSLWMSFDKQKLQ